MQTCYHAGGGVCVHLLKSVREGRFRNMWVGGGLTFFGSELPI